MKEMKICKIHGEIDHYIVKRSGGEGNWVSYLCSKCNSEKAKQNRPRFREKRSAYGKKWRAENQEKRREISRQYRVKRPEKIKEFKQNAKKKYDILRNEVLTKYGGNPPQCACCKESHIEFLCIDHINGGGNQHRKQLNRKTKGFWAWLRDNNFPEGYRVLCHNCNFSIGAHGFCPHTTNN
jgi:hypothetical protein